MRRYKKKKVVESTGKDNKDGKSTEKKDRPVKKLVKKLKGDKK